MFKIVVTVTFAASLAASAQMDMKTSGSTDKEKIADALRAGPPFITKDAVIADWPANPKAPNAEYRVLRAGKRLDMPCPESRDTPTTNQCVWIRPRCNGSRTASPTGPYASIRSASCTCSRARGFRTCMEHPQSADHTYHVGPHAMIITPRNEDLAKFNRYGSTGEIYISHLPGHSELYLIIPFKDWPQQ